MGPCSYTQESAGMKDEASAPPSKRVSVTPGVNNATVRVLLKKHKDRAGLEKLVKSFELNVPS